MKKSWKLLTLLCILMLILGISFCTVSYARSCATGDVVTFGTYPQTKNGTDDTPIEWIVLDVDAANQKALLISRYGLDQQPYNTKSQKVTWETCTLRAWLNDTFLYSAFSASEQRMILTTTVDNSTSQGHWKTDGGKNTNDKIFLLSYAEVCQYFGKVQENVDCRNSRVHPTKYAVKRGAFADGGNKTADGESSGSWWLRSPGHNQTFATRINPNGALCDRTVYIDSNCVRPVLWVDLNLFQP